MATVVMTASRKTAATAAASGAFFEPKKRVALGTKFESQEALLARRKAASSLRAVPAPTPAPATVPLPPAPLVPAPVAKEVTAALTKWDHEQQIRDRCSRYSYSRKDLRALRPKDPQWPGTQKELLDVYAACPLISPARASAAFVPILPPPSVVPGCGVLAGPCGYIYAAVPLPGGTAATQRTSPPPPPPPSAPTEADPRRLEQRQKQIQYGHNTLGYVNFVRCVPVHCRVALDPVEPFIGQKCSKRSWEGQVRKWRRLLHYYDGVVSPSDVFVARARIASDERARRAARKTAAPGLTEDDDEDEDESEGEDLEQ